jgi:sulfur carrier protein
VPGFLFSMALMNLQHARILVNDRERSVLEGTSIAALLGELGLQPKFLAVELNRRVVPRAEHPTTVLVDGDRIEVVTLVGGG